MMVLGIIIGLAIIAVPATRQVLRVAILRHVENGGALETEGQRELYREAVEYRRKNGRFTTAETSQPNFSTHQLISTEGVQRVTVEGKEYFMIPSDYLRDSPRQQ